MSTTRTGGCICGGIRYTAPEPLRPINVCHCSECRQANGGPAAHTAVREDRLEITRGAEAITWFKRPTSATDASHGFCPTCGTYLFFRIPGDELAYMSVTTLDDESGLPVAAHVWWDSRGPWENDDAAERIDGYGGDFEHLHARWSAATVSE